MSELISKQAVLNLIGVAKAAPLSMFRGINKYKSKYHSVMTILEASIKNWPGESSVTVLNQIKAEIEEFTEEHHSDELWKEDIFAIIDKHF